MRERERDREGEGAGEGEGEGEGGGEEDCFNRVLAYTILWLEAGCEGGLVPIAQSPLIFILV